MKKTLIIIMIALFCLLVWGGVLWLTNNNPYILQLTMHPDVSTTLEYGDEFKDFGPKAYAYRRYFNTGAIDVPVKINGEVDVNKVGAYELTYTARWEDQTVAQKRVVRVVDTQSPQITLIGEERYSILPGAEFKDPGVTAVDGYDGDLTEQVVVTRKGDQLIYTVTDASGNQAQAIRTVIVHDPVPPEIVLLGESELTISAGGFYQEPGYTAQDNCAGDLTEKVTITGSVDIFVPGTYKMIYQVTDRYNNMAQAVRTVHIKPVEGLTVGAPNGKKIYLTFDDGPGPYTQQLLDVLDQYDIKATFFVVENDYTDTLSRIARDGHSIGMHSASHSYKRIYWDEESYLKDFFAIEEHINIHTGHTPKLFRFPGGSSNTVSKKYNKGIMTRLTKQMTESGYVYFDWNVDSNDAGGAKTALEVFENVTTGVQEHQESVVLQHDVRPYSVEAVEEIIRWGLEKGYRFLPLTEESPTCHHPINN